MARFPFIPKTNKYHNKKTEIDGIVFDSKKEADYYCELKLLQRAGLIVGFDRQVKFVLQPGFKRDGVTYREISYKADFYVAYKDGHFEAVDVKGYKTDVYELKKKLLLYRYPELIFREV